MSFFIITVMVISLLSTFVSGTLAKGNEMAEYTDYMVKSGDTLWFIAKLYVPDNMDIRKYINRIMKENNMESPALIPGQVLHIPLL
ncbi:MAG: LysM peptidoglycan-binding domain-containing protein [Bacillota bacterium]|nr:LysM peptidoglycan-binding domain-containing protein [Bacillota bacterium]